MIRAALAAALLGVVAVAGFIYGALSALITKGTGADW